MICSVCGGARVRWCGPFSNLSHTECPDCGGRNCQAAEYGNYDEDEDEE